MILLILIILILIITLILIKLTFYAENVPFTNFLFSCSKSFFYSVVYIYIDQMKTKLSSFSFVLRTQKEQKQLERREKVKPVFELFIKMC